MALSLASTNAFAATPTVGVTGGLLTIGDLVTANFVAVTLDGTTRTSISTVNSFTVVDARGTGDGWSINLKATQLTSNTTKNIGLKTLPLSSLLLGTVSVVADSNATPVTGGITILQGAIDTAAGVNILSATINKGMGTYTVSIAPMILTLLPKDAKKGTYTSTITMTLSQGPTA